MSGKLDLALLEISDGLARLTPPPRRELHCAADVYAALVEAKVSEPSDWPPVPAEMSMYGHMEIIVKDGMPSGGYEITEDGEVVKRGMLSSVVT